MRWRRYFQRRRRDADLSQEIAHHIEQETDDNVARGMDAGEARAAANRKFGNRQAIHETVYEMNSIGWLEIVVQDLRYGIRQLRQRPGFAIAAITSLALGIGANTAIFTLVDQILLRMLPVDNPGELVQLRVDGMRPGGNWGDGLHTFPYPTYVALRDQNTVFSGLTGQRVEEVSLLDDRSAAAVTTAIVAGNYFDVLGVRPYLGRLLTPGDDGDVSGQAAAVLQHDFWRSQYQARKTIVGETIRLNGVPVTVVGVAAPGFEGTNLGFPIKVFVPVAMLPKIEPTDPQREDERKAWFYPFARLRPGVTLMQAEAAMKALYRQRQDVELTQAYFSQFPERREPFLRQIFTLEPGSRGTAGLRGRVEQPLVLLEYLAAAVLLIACANIAGLLLARGAASQRDLAIRRAIGASRGRIVGQLFTESVLLAVVSAIAALFIGAWLTRLLITLLSTNAADLSLSATPDLRVLAFTVAVTALTTVLFGLLPAWQNSRVAPVASMREGASTVTGGRTHVRARKIFVALQVGLSAVLLLGAGLFIRSLDNLRRVDLGLQSANVVTFQVRPAIRYDTARKVQAYRSLLQGLAAVPGVNAVGASRTPLFTGGRSDGVLALEGAVAGSGPEPFTHFNAVTPGYFEALGIPIQAGTAFDWRDWGSGKRLALVNEVVTARYFERAAPLDRMVGRSPRAAADTRIVGVFGSARYVDVRGEIPPQTFLNLDSVIEGVGRIGVYARVSGDPSRIMPLLRDEVRRIDPNMVITDMRTLDEQIDSRMSNERMLSFLSIGFALLATILAVVGVHGVLVFQIARRTQEIGVRMALGAGRSHIVRIVTGEMALVILTGLAVGVATAYAGGRYVQSQLFEVRADDPLVFAIAAATLLGAAGIATLIPALRLSRINLVRALRCD
jgi:putative ABC transport system permease protein